MITSLALLTTLAMTPSGTASFDGRYVDAAGSPQAYSVDAQVDGTITDSEGRTGTYSLAEDPTGGRVLTLDFGALGVHTMDEGALNCWEEAQPPVNPALQELAVCLAIEHDVVHYDTQVCDPQGFGPVYHTAAIYPAEAGHWMAGRLNPAISEPFWVHEVSYVLRTSGISLGYYCAPVDHRVQVFMGPDNGPPPADPVVLHEELVLGASLVDELSEITIALPSVIALPPDQSLYVSVEMIDDGVEQLCTTMCGDAPMQQDYTYWSDATDPSYPWYDLWTYAELGFHDMMVQAHGIVGY